MAKSIYRDTAFGLAQYPHLNKPDSKFNPDNPMFKTGLLLSGDDALNMKARVDEAAEAAYAAFFEEGDGKAIPMGKRKEYTVYRPYEEVTDDNTGDPTGDIVFDFKQNANIKLRDGTVKRVEIGIYDAKGEPVKDVLVRHGSEVRINYSMRPIPMKSLKQIGVRLDFGRVQVRKWAEGSAGGFGAVDGDEAPEGGHGGGFGSADRETEGSAGADY